MLKSKISKIESFKSVLKTVLVSIALVLSGFIQLVFFNTESENRIFWLLLIGVLLLIFIEIIAKIAENLIDSNSKLRKLILKEDFIEGVWIDITEINTYAIINIKYDNGEYHLQGESYDEEGKLLGNWESISTWSSNCKLRCNYKGNYENQISEFDGINEFVFISANKSIPYQFSGYYIDIFEKNKSYRIRGERINENDLKEMKTIKGVVNFVKKWAKDNKELLPDKSEE